jgi:hypothetical protein
VRSILILFFALLFKVPLLSQTVRYIKTNETVLPAVIPESSGIEYWNDILWTFNDSGTPELFGLDLRGNIKKKFLLSSARNWDWEDMTQDENFIYIADTGNNKGRRDTVAITKIDKNLLLADSVLTSVLRFTWPSNSGKKINYDCEAIIALGDSILLFTKEWKKRQTQIFTLSKHESFQTARHYATLPTRPLITSAALDSINNRVLLLGYSRWLKPMLSFLPLNFKKLQLDGPKRIKARFRRNQAEGICILADGSLIITSEAFYHRLFNRRPKLMEYKPG